MKILIAIDSFKGSASSSEVAKWLRKGISDIDPSHEIETVPISDGGEGLVDALVDAYNGKIYYEDVNGPKGKVVSAKYGMINETTAVVEMAEASGIHLIDTTKGDVYRASTYGVGQLILAAIARGAKKIYLGLGGSGTNDGGAGMAQALGYSLQDREGREILPGIQGLKDIDSIDDSNRCKSLDDIEIIALSDVNNPLTGPEGATKIFGAQKGVNPDQFEEEDQWLSHYDALLSNHFKKEIGIQAGAGAAGGLGAGLLAFCRAEIKNGINEILQLISLEQKMKTADLVITGEGKMDSQSLKGKGPVGIAKLAKACGCPTISVVGSYEEDIAQIYEEGIDVVIPIIHRPMALEEAIKSVESNVLMTGQLIARILKLKKRL